MSKTVSKFALAAGVVLALVFTLSCSGSGSSDFVGKWVRDDGSESMELFKDGTGVAQASKGDQEVSMSMSWKLAEKRFIATFTVQGSLISQAYDYEISSKKLTLTNDKGEKEIYVKPQEGKIEGKTLTDSRDGKKYKTIIIGERTWMAENLNYEANGTDDFGFSALPGGHFSVGLDASDLRRSMLGGKGGSKSGSHGSFNGVGENGSWWSANEDAYSMDYYSDNTSWNNFVESSLYSVRCVQD